MKLKLDTIRFSGPDRTPTCNFRFRRTTLFAVELRDHLIFQITVTKI
jgi:hypothetical protein